MEEQESIESKRPNVALDVDPESEKGKILDTLVSTVSTLSAKVDQLMHENRARSYSRNRSRSTSRPSRFSLWRDRSTRPGFTGIRHRDSEQRSPPQYYSILTQSKSRSRSPLDRRGEEWRERGRSFSPHNRSSENEEGEIEEVEGSNKVGGSCSNPVHELNRLSRNEEDELEDCSNKVSGSCSNTVQETGLTSLKGFFGSSEATSPSIDKNLAMEVNEGLCSHPPKEKVREVEERYLRPENVTNLRVPSTNIEVYRKMPRQFRNRDRKLQSVHNLATKTLIASVQLLNTIKAAREKKQTLDIDECDRVVTDITKLQSACYAEISVLRKDNISGFLPEELKSLCKHSQQKPTSKISLGGASGTEEYSTEFLFGKDIDKEINAISESNKIGAKISGGFSKNFQRGRSNFNRSGGPYHHQQQYHHQQFRRHDFLPGRYSPHQSVNQFSLKQYKKSTPKGVYKRQ